MLSDMTSIMQCVFLLRYKNLIERKITTDNICHQSTDFNHSGHVRIRDTVVHK